ncbi:MAG: hypothetical protein IJC48_01810 [Clostridia bacterium]|nr:hypothetical protein [Clostridia bacterium]
MATILTLDAGTSGLKCSLFDESGALIGAMVAEYPVYYPRDGWAEQKSEDFISAVKQAVASLGQKADLSSVAAIGLTGTMNGCIAIDKDGQALHPNIIHLDTRAQTQVDKMERIIGMKAFYSITGNRPDVHYGLPKLMWLKEHAPDVYKNARWFVNTKDVIYGYLTGLHGRSDYSDASLFGAMNISARKWDEDVCKAAEIDMDKLPLLFPSSDVSGRLSKAAANDLGLAGGIPVAIGAGDGPCSTHGSGVYDENGAYLTIGSSAWVAGLKKTPCFDEDMRAFNYTDIDENLTTVCGTVQCASTAFDFMMKTVFGITNESGEIDFSLAEKMAASSIPGANGLFFLPTLMGERCPWWDSNARGMLMGLTLTHTRNDMVRCAYEGVAQALNNCAAVLRENGLNFKSLVLSGGGMKSKIWPQMFADVIDAPCSIHLNPREATSLGAAVAAGVGAGVFKNYEEASKIVKTSAALQPDAKNARLYRAHTRAYREMYNQTASAMHTACEYQSADQ